MVIGFIRRLFRGRRTNQFGATGEITVVVCRTLADVKYFDKNAQFQGHTVVACDNPKGRELAATLVWVDEVTFTEEEESIFTVASAVKELFDTIDEWLREQSDGRIPSELLFWQRHPEGRRTAVRLQDAVILVKSYQSLLKDGQVDRLILRRHASWRWEDQLLLSVASASDVNITTIDRVKFRIATKMNLVPVSEFVGNVPDSFWLPRGIVHAMLTGKLFVDVIGGYLRGAIGRSNSKPEVEETVALQLCSDAEKHIENVVPLLTAFEGSDYPAAALTWRAGDAARSLTERGYSVTELESYLSVNFVREIATAGRFAWRACNEATSFRCNQNLRYKGVNLGVHLWPQMREYLWYHLPRRVLFSNCFEEYATTTDMAALKVWGGGLNDIGRLSTKIAADHGDPLTFHYNLGAMGDWPYFVDRCDLYLASGDIEAERLERMGVSSNRIESTGHGRYDSLSGFTEQHSVASSRSRLGLPEESSVYVFYAPNGIVRGMHCAAEQSRVLDSLAKFAGSHPEATVFAKPHPNSDEAVFRHWAEDAESDNVTAITGEQLPYHCLNAADVVVTKLSTVGIEALLFDCHVVSVALDGEDRFQSVFGDAAERVQTTDKFLSSLDRLATSNLPAEQNQAARQRFLDRQFSTQEDASGRMRDAITSRLNNSNLDAKTGNKRNYGK